MYKQPLEYSFINCYDISYRKGIFKFHYKGGLFMKLGFIGADHEVTGSCHYVEACNKRILVDCGLEQGRDIYVNQDIPVPIRQID